MKKILSVFLIVIVIFTASFAIAEDETTVTELMQSMLNFTKERLDSLIEFYQGNPGSFDDEYAEMTYRYFVLYRTMNEIVSIETNYELKQNEFSLGKGIREKEIFNETSINTDEMLEQIYYSYWFSFRKKEVTIEQLMELIINQAKVSKTT